LKNKSFLGLARVAVHIGALIPLLWLLMAALTGRLTFNPVQYLEQRTGDFALILLFASLACTPVAILAGNTALRQFRRPLGLYAAAYAAIHVGLFIWLDYGADWGRILNTLADRSSLWFGLASLILLLVLAVTSFKSIRRRMNVWWERVHKLAYLAAILVLVHFALTVKGNILNLSGRFLGPLAAIMVLAILLFIRTPTMRSFIDRLRGKIHQDKG
jgi:methionine sulfoxide reductase heme-binding subunit